MELSLRQAETETAFIRTGAEAPRGSPPRRVDRRWPHSGDARLFVQAAGPSVCARHACVLGAISGSWACAVRG